jgi:hypothetical protein
MSYVDLVETMLVKKEDMKPTGIARIKKAIRNTCQDDSMDTTPIPEESPSSTTMILRPLSNTFNYQTEPMCAD